MIEDAIKAGALKGFDDKAGFLSMVDKQKAKVGKQTEEAAEDKTREIIWNEKVAGLQKQFDDGMTKLVEREYDEHVRYLMRLSMVKDREEEAAAEEAHHRGA